MGKADRLSTIFLTVLVLVCAMLTSARAQTGKTPSLDEERIIQKAKNEIIKELREGQFLKEQIRLGIEDYVKQQKEAQVAAQAEEARRRDEKIKAVRRVSVKRDHIFGNPDAVISLVEYSDFECPFCKNFHQTAKQIVKTYEGKVNWVYRHFPLPFHNPGAQKQAEASECAQELGGNDGFWKFADAIYERTKSNGNGFPLNQLTPLAKEIGLDEKRFATCYDSGKYQARVNEDLDEGKNIGITGTPANILLHNRTGQVVFKSGAQPFEAFKSEIDKMLEAK